MKKTTDAHRTRSAASRVRTWGWRFALVAVGAALVGILGSSMALDAIARDDADAAFADSETILSDARGWMLAAQAQLDDARDTASAAYEESGQFIETVRSDLLADETTLVALEAGRSELLTVSGLRVEDDRVITPAATQIPSLRVTEDESIDGRRAQAEINLSLAEEYEKTARTARRQAAEVVARAESLLGLVDGVILSGTAFGSDVSAVEKAEPALLDALRRAVAGLGDASTPADSRFAAYAAAYDAAKRSHDDVVAADAVREQEEAARRSRVGTSGDEGDGGPQGPSATFAPRDPTPATFEAGEGFVPWTGDCVGHAADVVGPGGHSTMGRMLAAQGLTWTAVIAGEVVYYSLCS